MKVRRSVSARKKISAVGIGAALALSLTACGSGGGSGDNAAGRDLLSNVESSGKVTIGTSNDMPWSAVKDGKATGIIPDLLREYFERKDMDVKVESTSMPFDSLIPSVNSGRIQVMGDAMYRTPEREKQVAFTDVLFYNTEGLTVAEGNPLNLSQIEDLCGYTGATYKGTVWVEDLKKASAKCPSGKEIKVKVYSTIYEAFQDIQTGRVDGVLADASIAALAMQENDDLKIELSPDYEPVNKGESDNALAVKTSNKAFVDDFSKVYKEMREDGAVEKIFNKWGLKPAAPWLEK